MTTNCEKEKKEEIRNIVRDGYAKIAREAGSCCSRSSGVASSEAPAVATSEAESVATAVGYSVEQLQGLPENANMGLSCGNPTALASLKDGEVVLDLGAGGGLDVFLAARQVGASGRAIGVDMTYDMINMARANSRSFKESAGLDNTEFRLGEIEHLPVADNSVDVVISNCVINLSPDKPQVWREIARVLKPGGRACVSDLALLKPLPESVLGSVQALLGCIAGAVLIDETRQMVAAAGLAEAIFDTKGDYIDNLSKWSDPFYKEIASQIPPDTKLSDYVTSLNITARKPVTN